MLINCVSFDYLCECGVFEYLDVFVYGYWVIGYVLLMMGCEFGWEYCVDG